MYLPFAEMADSQVSQTPVFYGAVNVYLEQKMPFYRRLPQKWRQHLDTPGILRWAASKAGTTQATNLGDMTLSVLEGREGRQQAELDQMIDWLKQQPPVDIVHLSNALLLGLAPVLRSELHAQIVCTLQDEDTWLDALPAPWGEKCWDQIRVCAQAVDVFTPVSNTYAQKMQAQLAIPHEKCRVLPPGVDTDLFYPSTESPSYPTIGFLSEMNEIYGLDILVDAFLNLRARPLMHDVHLHATGSLLKGRSSFLDNLMKKITAAGAEQAVAFTEDFQTASSRSAFLRSLTVMSVPARRPEAFGLFQIESMACGVPVVQPRIGGYPEVVQATGGGVIYDDISPNGLANALFDVLADPDKVASLAKAGRNAVVTHFQQNMIATKMKQLYAELLTL
jgi:glycosyltransferase involved in cell wall biosynthesis